MRLKLGNYKITIVRKCEFSTAFYKVAVRLQDAHRLAFNFPFFYVYVVEQVVRAKSDPNRAIKGSKSDPFEGV